MLELERGSGFESDLESDCLRQTKSSPAVTKITGSTRDRLAVAPQNSWGHSGSCSVPVLAWNDFRLKGRGTAKGLRLAIAPWEEISRIGNICLQPPCPSWRLLPRS